MIQLRRAERADVATILRFIKELADYEKLAHRVHATEAKLEASLFGDHPVAEVILAEEVIAEQSDALGFALYFQNYSTFLAQSGTYLEDLYVRPEARGKGVGLMLMRAVAARTVERGGGRMDWAVLDWNTPAIEFYDRIGAIDMHDWKLRRMESEVLHQFASASSF
jgi:GNAT superfamily N-acetyltransferase